MSLVSCLFLFLCHCLGLVLLPEFLKTRAASWLMSLSPASVSSISLCPLPPPLCMPFRSRAMLFHPGSDTRGKELRVAEMAIKLLVVSSSRVPVFYILPCLPVSKAVESMNCFMCCPQLSTAWLPAFRHSTREKVGYCYCCCCSGRNQHLSRVPDSLSNPF